MTSAATLARYGLLMALVCAGAIGISNAHAQTNSPARPNGAAENDDAVKPGADEVEVELVDRGKVRLTLLLSLVKNELRASTLKRSQLISERAELTRERAELSALGEKRRPADNVRLDQIESRLGTLGRELDELGVRLPEIAAEHDDLQRRLDEANGVVREVTATSADQINGDDGSEEDKAASIWLDGKRRIQEALVYLGDYNGLIDGDFGPRTSAAVEVYQRSLNETQTGTLTEEQEKLLLTEAQAHRYLYGVRLEDNKAMGYQVSYPTLLLSETETLSPNELRLATTDGKCELLITVLNEGQDLNTLFDQAAANYEVDYQRNKGGWFVLSGLTEDDLVVYDTVRPSNGKLIRARLTYPQDQQDFWSPFAVIMFNTFNASPTS